MDYFDALHNNGWLADPSDRVHVVAVHQVGCPGEGGCGCVPRLVLLQAENLPMEPRRSNVVPGPGWIDEDAVQVG